MTPDLASYDFIVINSSAGKDSQAMLDVVAREARLAGVPDERIVVVHCDLGRVEWPGTRELAEEHTRHYGYRFEVVSRRHGDLLEHVERMGFWPRSSTRYCTSDHKRDQVARLLTRLTAEAIGAVKGRAVRILQCLGIRAAESPARSKLPAFSTDKRASNGRREVHLWLPLHGWSVEQVWHRIQVAGTRRHYAYDLGMPRLSCSFCIFAGRDALLLAGHARTELLREYVRVEGVIGHKFRKELALSDILADVEAGEQPGEIRTWEG